MNIHIINLFSIIKVNSIKKNSVCYVFKNKKIDKILHLLYNEGFIKLYYYDESIKKYKIYLKYDFNNPFIRNIINLSKPSYKLEISAKKINKLLGKINYDYLLISSSKYGYMLIKDNLSNNNNNIGGQVIAAFTLNTSIYKVRRKHINSKKSIYKHIVI